ncbi:cytochrome P450 [Dictyobacter aurantiacus]|uniref:Putative cytochrome P450 YjiB n=1 Tax=Dictyobacter aurantiacus TaxID=1936993 RepID=A0A401ZQ34_9CHLR|nr:cytochrome P450 [Dictyobacter aurantiacus]GCE09018.1 putative cytochrome P450 YjiB [Dictyobacter aurantiacus]
MSLPEAHSSEPSLTAHILNDPLNPFPWYRVMRERYPVYYSREFHSWFITRYSDVQRVISDPLLFSSEQSIRARPTNKIQPTTRPLLWTDPPRHRQLRSLINQAFTPRTIANLAPRITEIVHAHLDQVAARGQMDVVSDLANPLPIIVIAELLGIPIQDQQRFKHWSDIIVSPARQQKKQAVIEMNNYFQMVVDQRRQHAQDDLISALLSAHIEGTYLTDAEILSFCRLLLVAGHETSTNLIGNALLTFDEHPEAFEELQSRPELLPGAIEEVVRYRTPIQRLRRATTVDTQLGEHHIKAGEIVSPILGAANRDETQFSAPEVFDIHRNPNRHIGFGHGIHFCIGSSLARLETKIALEILLSRFTSLRRIPDVPLQHVTSSFVYGVKSLPMTFRERQ